MYFRPCNWSVLSLKPGEHQKKKKVFAEIEVFFPWNQVKTKKKVFAKNWSVFSLKSSEDQKKIKIKKVFIAIWDYSTEYIWLEFVEFIRDGWLLIVQSSSAQILMGGRLNLYGGC